MRDNEFISKIRHLEEYLLDNLVPHAHKNCGKPIYFILSNEPIEIAYKEIEVSSTKEAKKIARIIDCDAKIIDETSPYSDEYYLSVWVWKP